VNFKIGHALVACRSCAARKNNHISGEIGLASLSAINESIPLTVKFKNPFAF
jgi:hypothetical protein